MRLAAALIRGHCRWEHAGQPFFSGEVEPCINGRTVTLGTYLDHNMDGVVARLLNEQLEDGGWNCEAEHGSVRSSFATTINVLEGLLAHERATGGSAESIAARRRGEEYLLERELFRRKTTGEVVSPSLAAVLISDPRTAMVGPAGGTRCARCGFSVGTRHRCLR
jgi:hypothetical protein